MGKKVGKKIRKIKSPERILIVVRWKKGRRDQEKGREPVGKKLRPCINYKWFNWKSKGREGSCATHIVWEQGRISSAYVYWVEPNTLRVCLWHWKSLKDILRCEALFRRSGPGKVFRQETPFRDARTHKDLSKRVPWEISFHYNWPKSIFPTGDTVALDHVIAKLSYQGHSTDISVPLSEPKRKGVHYTTWKHPTAGKIPVEIRTKRWSHDHFLVDISTNAGKRILTDFFDIRPYKKKEHYLKTRYQGVCTKERGKEYRNPIKIKIELPASSKKAQSPKRGDVVTSHEKSKKA